jgi:septal ring-binding cell division protein DamX
MFRMRAAGYKGPDVFSAAAVLHIGKASQGLMRRVNILADKALLAAFVENTHKIESRHVQAAIRDSEMVPMRTWFNRKIISMVGGTALLAATLAGAGWFLGQNSKHVNDVAAQSNLPPQIAAPSTLQPQSADAVSAVLPTSEVLPVSAVAETSNGTILPLDKTLTLPAEPPVVAARHPSPRNLIAQSEKEPSKPISTIAESALLQQRLGASQSALSAPDHGKFSIQLFYTDDIRPERMERFLIRANNLGKLEEIYIVPIKLSGRDGYRVLYGLYANSDKARIGMEELPQRYKDAFAPTLYLLEDSQKTP